MPNPLHDNNNNAKGLVLLTLPRSDVGPQGTSSTTTVSAKKASSHNSSSSSLATAPPPPPPPPLLLLQLPPGWKARDLKGARFVASRHNNNSSHATYIQQQQQQQQQPASLVVERKRISFSLQRVETSNALVLVPPHLHLDDHTSISNSSTSNNKRLKVSRHPDNDDDDDDDDPQPKQQQKKQQQQQQQHLPVVAVRLLNRGSGAWFLQGQPQALVLQRLSEALQQHVYNTFGILLDHPNNTHDDNDHHHDDMEDDMEDDMDDMDMDTRTTNGRTTTTHTTMVVIGRTVESLALQFQCTQYEIQVGLSKLEHAFLLPPPVTVPLSTSTSPSSLSKTRTATILPCYGLLSQPATLLVRDAILATLLEETDEFADYATTGVTLSQLVVSVVQRLLETATHLPLDHAECLARHGILQLQNHDDNEDGQDDQDEIRLSVTQVAVWVARRLLLLSTAQKSPGGWEQPAFLTKWQSQMPGVGKVYTVHWSMLRGIAVLVDSSGSNKNTSNNSSSVDNVIVNGHDHDREDDSVAGTTTRIHYLPRDQLPTRDAAAYMAQLFAVQEQWEWIELQPYVEYLSDFTGTSSADILLQFTKIVSVNTMDNNNNNDKTRGAVGGSKSGGVGGLRDVYVKR